MAAGATYTPIATTTVSGTSTNQVTFSSISSSYTDIVAIINAAETSTGNTMYCVLNSDTGTNYSTTTLNGNGTSASSSRASNQAVGFIGGWNVGMSSTIGQALVYFNNYSNSTTYKTFMSRYGLSSAEINTSVNLWRSTAAITSIQFKLDANNFSNGSTFTLYGIASA